MREMGRIAKWIHNFALPLMLLLLLCLTVQSVDMSALWPDVLAGGILLWGLPAAVYPISRTISTLRELESKHIYHISLLLGILGGLLLGACGIVRGMAPTLFWAYSACMFSRWFLAVINMPLDIPADRSVCEILTTLLLAGCMINWQAALPFGLLYLALALSTLMLHHDMRMAFLWGSLCAVLGFLLAAWQSILLRQFIWL